MRIPVSCKGTNFVLLFLFCGLTLFGQNRGQIQGNIIDDATGLPIPFASVYFNNTSIGIVADSLGNYKLNQVPIHYTDLIFSSVGYESFAIKVSLSSGQVLSLNARLRPSKKLLNEIVVRGKRDKQWNEYYERFFKEFIGTGPYASQCEIENAGVLNFYVTDGGGLKASAGRPLEIYNRALGYKILVSLEQFDLSSYTYQASFHSRFVELNSKNAREEFKWQVNRNQSYKGSLRHFLKSLIDKRLESEGFRVYLPIEARFRNGSQAEIQPTLPVSSDVLSPEFIRDGKLKDYYRLLKKGVFEIHYLSKIIPKSKSVYSDFPHPVSWLEIFDESLFCPPNGILKSNSNYVVSGYMSTYRMADLLPEDYDPTSNEAKVHLTRNSTGRGDIQGIIIDSASGRSLAGARVFINNSLYKTQADDKGRFELKKIPQGIYTLVAAFGSNTVKGRQVEVRGDSISNVKVSLALKVIEPRDQPAYFDGNVAEDLKNMYFTKYFLNWHFPSSRILNPNALEIKILKNKILMRTSTPLEIVDDKTGYKINYYLKDAEIHKERNGKRIVHGFASFDTLSTKNFKDHEMWPTYREDSYRGSVNHFIRSLAEGRSREEGFEIYSTTQTINNDHRKKGIRGKRITVPVLSDSLLAIGNSKAMFKLKLPENATVRFEGGKATSIEADSTLQISVQGTFNEVELSVKGPMKERELPILPIEYNPVGETITDPKVWVFIREK